MSKELFELLRKCLIMGGPLADEAVRVIQQDFPHMEIAFIYPHVVGGEQWTDAYRNGPTE